MILDMNLDGIDDLIVSCPTSGDRDKIINGGNYDGRIKIFFGAKDFNK